MLPTPSFHHLHLNSVDPDAAIAFYTRQFPTTSKTTLGRAAGAAVAEQRPDPVHQGRPPRRRPSRRRAIWHFGWHVTDTRKRLGDVSEPARGQRCCRSTPSDDGRLGPRQQRHLARHRRRARPDQSADRRGQAAGRPARRAAAASRICEGPERALVEIRRRLPGRALQPRALVAGRSVLRPALVPAAPQRAGPRRAHRRTPLTEATCKVPRGADRTWPALEPRGHVPDAAAGVDFGDVALTWYAHRATSRSSARAANSRPHRAQRRPISTPGSPSCSDEGIDFLDEPYQLGDTRAVMIEGPSREAIELVQV